MSMIDSVLLSQPILLTSTLAYYRPLFVLLIISLVVSIISLALNISSKLETKKIQEDTRKLKETNEELEKIQKRKEQQRKIKSLQHIISFLETLNYYLLGDLIQAKKKAVGEPYNEGIIPIYKSEYDASHTSYHPNTQKSIFYFTFTQEEFYSHLNNIKNFLPEENFFFIQNHVMLFNTINQQLPREISFYEMSSEIGNKEWVLCDRRSYAFCEEDMESYLQELNEGHLRNIIQLDRLRDFQKREGLLNETLAILKKAGNMDSSTSDALEENLRNRVNEFRELEYEKYQK